MQFGGDSVECDFNCLNLPLLASLRSNATSPKFSRAQLNPSGSAVSLYILILILVLHVLEITWSTFILDINKSYFKLVQTWTHNLTEPSLSQVGINLCLLLVSNCKEITESPNWKRLLLVLSLLMKWTWYAVFKISTVIPRLARFLIAQIFESAKKNFHSTILYL